MESNYVTRDNYGMYANSSTGPGPELMGANTLLGNDVYNKDDQDLGDIKEFMIGFALVSTIELSVDRDSAPMKAVQTRCPQ